MSKTKRKPTRTKPATDRYLASDVAEALPDGFEAEARRARTKLIVGPTLAALRAWREEVTSHLDQSIALLEHVETWADGRGVLPEPIQRIGELLAMRPEGPMGDMTADAQEELSSMDGPVFVADLAIEEMASVALSPWPVALNTSALRIASSLAQYERTETMMLRRARAVFESSLSLTGIECHEGVEVGPLRERLERHEHSH